MEQINDIRQRAEEAKDLYDSNCLAYKRCNEDIPRLCDALEFVMAIARDECESPYFDEIAKILEGK